MVEKKEPEEKSEGMAEGVLRELGLGNLIDLALKSPAFQQRFKEVNKEIEERISEARPSTRLGIRPHVESGYSVRYIREETSGGWKPARKPVRKPVKKIMAEEPERAEPPVDVFDEGDHLRVVAEPPGIEEHDIKTEAKGTMLTILAERGDRKYSERIELPTPITGEISLTYKHGVLELKLKKKVSP